MRDIRQIRHPPANRPALPAQLVACRTVAWTLAALALAPAAPAPVPEIAGPTFREWLDGA
ncbi:hypothetical protein DMB42_50040 [Nonomuraea sp. WAC 01424]|uniref:hypothetical protein n=1 Tax=Nonomuraea sp. WAC 01424 TaxID=2203200 RepID=UPI000F7792DD|nr:hypothetical protein [Nonomuraea sp. WAC 01424]RSM95274.1 hypothetical protein DMB42_50040 [Nonomuraea sp. WAC 01424]